MPKLDLQVPDFKAPDIKVPDFKASVPDFKAPDIKVPDFKAPDFSAAKFDMPKFDMPKMDMPKMDMPKVDMPKIDAPAKKAAPEFKAPDIKVPEFSAPKFSGFDLPKLDLPKLDLPKVDAPKVALPKAPSFSSPQSDYVSTDFEQEDSDPQEARDQRAADAKSVYKDADKAAKVRFLDQCVNSCHLNSQSLISIINRKLKQKHVSSETLLTQRRKLPRLLRTKLARLESEERSFVFVHSTRDTRRRKHQQLYSLVMLATVDSIMLYGIHHCSTWFNSEHPCFFVKSSTKLVRRHRWVIPCYFLAIDKGALQGTGIVMLSCMFGPLPLVS